MISADCDCADDWTCREHSDTGIKFELAEPENNDISFFPGDYSNDAVPALKLCTNGDIYVKGRLVENDKEVVNGMRALLGFQPR